MEPMIKLNLLGRRGTVHAASMVTGSKREWQMRQEQKSPC